MCFRMLLMPGIQLQGRTAKILKTPWDCKTKTTCKEKHPCFTLFYFFYPVIYEDPYNLRMFFYIELFMLQIPEAWEFFLWLSYYYGTLIHCLFDWDILTEAEIREHLVNFLVVKYAFYIENYTFLLFGPFFEVTIKQQADISWLISEGICSGILAIYLTTCQLHLVNSSFKT